MSGQAPPARQLPEFSTSRTLSQRGELSSRSNTRKKTEKVKFVFYESHRFLRQGERLLRNEHRLALSCLVTSANIFGGIKALRNIKKATGWVALWLEVALVSNPVKHRVFHEGQL
jgi:hypothetical protein